MRNQLITSVSTHRLSAAAIVLGGWIGFCLPVTDLTCLDLSHGRYVHTTGRLHPPAVGIAAEGSEPPAGWLGSWALFESHNWGGEVGLRMLAALLSAAGVSLFTLVSPGPAGLVAGVAALAVAAPVMEISTLLYSWPLLAAMGFLIGAIRERPLLWAPFLPFLVLIWSVGNREAAIGVFLLAAVLLEMLVKRLARPSDDHAASRPGWLPLGVLAVSTVLSLALVLVVLPGGVSNLQDPIRYSLLMNQAEAEDWGPVSLPGAIVFFAYAALAGFAAGRRPWRTRVVETVVLGAFAVLTLVSRHFIVSFAAMAAPAVAHLLAPHLQRAAASDSPALRSRMTTIWAVVLATLFALPRVIEERKQHPYERAVQILSDYRLTGTVVNVPEVGGLLLWRATESKPLFELRPESLSSFHRQAEAGESTAVLRSQDAPLALLSWRFISTYATPDDLRISGLLPIYFDDIALLYARPQSNPSTVGRYALAHVDPLKDPNDYVAETLPLATRELFDLLALRGPSTRGSFLLGRLLLREGKEEEAMEAFEAARQLSPDDTETLCELSDLYIRKGMYGLAEQTSRRAIALGADDAATVTHNLARALYGQGRFEEAAAWFERVLAAHPDDLGALRSIVDIFQRLGRPDLVLGYRQRLTTVEQRELTVLLDEAERRRRDLDFPGAADAYQRAHEIRPDDGETLWDLAVVLLADRRNEPAAEVLRELVQREPERAVAHLTLGMVCARELDCAPDEARRHLQTFLDLLPEDINAEAARRELAALARRRPRK